MPIKDVAAAMTPERLGKDDLVGRLLLIEMEENDPAYEGNYGPTHRVSVHLREVAADGISIRSQWLFGNLAEQLAAALAEGETGLGRVIAGVGREGRRWYGIEWSRSDEDFEAAKQFVE